MNLYRKKVVKAVDLTFTKYGKDNVKAIAPVPLVF